MAHDRTWRKSSYSANQGECVEVTSIQSHVAVRDSKDPHGPVLTVTPEGWADLIAHLRSDG
jgi:hypothetical protein